MPNRLADRLNRLDSKTLNVLTGKIARVDEFKGWWKGALNLSPQWLGRLKRSIVITSTGASTRIEGSTLSDQEVERLLKGLKVGKLKDRDAQEVAGYAQVLRTVFDAHAKMRFTEGLILQLHGMLLQYTDKDQARRGKYKDAPNKVVAVDERGGEAVLFNPTPPHLTPMAMKELVDWTRAHLKNGDFHPILVIANFVLEFLAIHPFHDGNGRLSRVLTNLLLAHAGYAYMPYASLEKIIEDHKIEYYLALRQAQKDIRSPDNDISRWLNFFVDVMLRQIAVLQGFIAQSSRREDLLSANQQRALALFEQGEELTCRLLVKELKIPAATAKQTLHRLLELKLVKRVGQGRSVRYLRAGG